MIKNIFNPVNIVLVATLHELNNIFRITRKSRARVGFLIEFQITYQQKIHKYKKLYNCNKGFAKE